jgi:hypothetical protein
MNARKALLVVTAPALVAGIVGMSASQAVASTTALTASLSGANESGGAGDPKASGSVSLTVDTTSGQVCATVTSGITGAVAMHIHERSGRRSTRRQEDQRRRKLRDSSGDVGGPDRG